MNLITARIKPEKFYTVSEVAGILSLSEQTIRKRIHEKRYNKPGLDYIFDGIYRIPGYSIIKYIKEHSHIKLKEDEYE